jgi:hypothetical protein
MNLPNQPIFAFKPESFDSCIVFFQITCCVVALDHIVLNLSKQFVFHLAIVHSANNSVPSLATLTPAINVVDGNVILLRHLVDIQIIAFFHYYLLLFSHQHIILTITLLCLRHLFIYLALIRWRKLGQRVL